MLTYIVLCRLPKLHLIVTNSCTFEKMSTSESEFPINHLRKQRSFTVDANVCRPPENRGFGGGRLSARTILRKQDSLDRTTQHPPQDRLTLQRQNSLGFAQPSGGGSGESVKPNRGSDLRIFAAITKRQSLTGDDFECV